MKIPLSSLYKVMNMKLIQRLLNESFAKKSALFMRYVCYIIIVFMALGIILSCMGRLTFSLHSNFGTFEHAIYAEENHQPHSRSFIIHTKDDIHVWTNTDDQIYLFTHIGLSAMFALETIAIMIAYWLLSYIHKGKIFTETNAHYLLLYGLLQFLVALFVPFIKLLLCTLISLVSSNTITIATGQDMLSSLIPSIAFIVAAYIIHYGIYLQDEVDHTL